MIPKIELLFKAPTSFPGLISWMERQLPVAESDQPVGNERLPRPQDKSGIPMRTILIYDPDRDLVELMGIALELEGYTAVGFQDERTDLLELIRTSGPEVVILNFIHTGEFGSNWCRLIKDHYPDITVIALSCNDQIGSLYNDRGFDDYIPKPFTLERLYDVIGKYI